MESSYYIVVTRAGGREERTGTFSDRAYMSFGMILRDADESLRRVDVCKDIGLIVRGWDRSEASGRWVRSI